MSGSALPDDLLQVTYTKDLSQQIDVSASGTQTLGSTGLGVSLSGSVQGTGSLGVNLTFGVDTTGGVYVVEGSRLTAGLDLTGTLTGTASVSGLASVEINATGAA